MVGALAGFAVGVMMAQKMGGLSGITEKLRAQLGGTRSSLHDPVADIAEVDDELYDEFEDDGLDDEDSFDASDDEDFDATLEERVLEAFRNDPILAECAIDIGALGDGIIELAGMVDTEKEADHAVVVARGVPDVETVVNRILVGVEESIIADTTRRFAGSDPELAEGHWEGQQVGIGKRRQGSSEDVDRHSGPKAELEERWLSQSEAMRNSADDDIEGPGAGNRAKKGAKKARGGRTDGSAIAPTGVPKADHVVDPESASDGHRAD